MDWFGRPPRVQRWTVNEDGFADREVVAMMKRTDRDKDWPNGLRGWKNCWNLLQCRLGRII